MSGRVTMQPSLVKPPRLKVGDTIGIIAPAGPVVPSEIQPGVELLRSMGYRVVISPHLYEKQQYLAGDDKTRLEDFHAMLDSREVRAIFCARGGYGSMRLLGMIEFDRLRSNPKIIVGYSDITALLLAIFKETGLVTFHGPMVKELAQGSGGNLTSLLRVVSSEGPLQWDLGDANVLKAGRGEGILLGGNLSLICHMIGTPFMPSLSQALLFLEEKEEPPYRVDRMMTHLRLSGQLRDVSGLIGGSFEGCGEISAIDRVLVDAVFDRPIPVVSGLPVGHGPENICLPIGIKASLDTDERILSGMEPCVGE